MKYRNTQMYEYDNKLKRDYIKEHLLKCYDKLYKGENVDGLIRVHRCVINEMELPGNNRKKKYKTLTYLEHYRNTEDKTLAMAVLTNTLRRGRPPHPP